jgi:hypothetical protein
LIVPLNKNGTCGIIDILLLNECNPIDSILQLPINIYPSIGFAILNIACKILDLPAPVLPTIPTFYPYFTEKDRFLRTVYPF